MNAYLNVVYEPYALVGFISSLRVRVAGLSSSGFGFGSPGCPKDERNPKGVEGSYTMLGIHTIRAFVPYLSGSLGPCYKVWLPGNIGN